MRKLLLSFFVLTIAAPVAAADLTGRWSLGLTPDFSGHDDTIECSFVQDGEKLTVDCGAGPNIVGDLKGRTVTLVVPTGRNNELRAKMTGELDQRATTITGKWQLTDDAGDREGKFTATKQ